jgi:hypothetical protein
MITEHRLLAVDHSNIARVDDEFAAMGRRLAVSLARVMGPPDCQGDGTTVARY